MSTKIRLKRTGRKGQHTFRIVVTDESKARDGRPIEELGSFNPHTDELQIDTARADYWKDQGALPSPRAKKLLKWAVDGIPVKPKKAKPKPKAPEAEAPAESEEAVAAETPAEEAQAEAPAEEAQAEAPAEAESAGDAEGAEEPKEE